MKKVYDIPSKKVSYPKEELRDNYIPDKNNPFVDFTFTPNFHLGHLLQWKIDPVFSDAGPFIFTVEMAETPDFSEITMELPSVAGFFAIDKTNHKITQGDTLRYRVKLQTAQGIYYSNILNFGISHNDQRTYLLASEVQRKELLRIHFYVHSEGWLLKRRNYGVKDTATSTFISGLPATDNSSDYGVGLTGGYYNPLGFVWSKEEYNESKTLSEDTGVDEVYALQIRTIGFPLIEEQDIIIHRGTDYRYMVRERSYTYFPGTQFVLVQRLGLVRIPITDTVYQIPMPAEYVSELYAPVAEEESAELANLPQQGIII